MSIKTMMAIGLFVIVLMLAPMMIGINDAGQRTVVQYPNGTINIKFSPGMYMQWFGKVDIYNDVTTFDFDKSENPEGTTLEQIGISVRYQDGGMGTVFGILRFSLPADEESMLNIHKDFRSNQGVANKLLKTLSEESMNLTAGLMSSEEAYAEKRGVFTDWARTQVKKGPFITEISKVNVKDEATGKMINKTVPVISYGKNGLAKHVGSDLSKYGITVSGFQIVDWGFEPKTLDQISAKREATMAIITAKATAERAKQDALTAEEQGKANVMTAKYEQEVEKEKAVVIAEREKEVAVIQAVKLVDVATQQKLEAEQKKLTAAEYKQEQILRGEGDGEYKRLIVEADGALAQKLAAEVSIHEVWAKAYANRAVPQTVFSSGDSGAPVGGDSEVSNFMNIMTMNAAKQLNYNRATSDGKK